MQHLETIADQHPIVLFDGVCNLCNTTVQFIIRHDRQHLFRFAALQSEAGLYFLKKYNLPTQNFESFVLVYQQKHYTQSNAALNLLYHLGSIWRIGYGLILVPPFLRNSIYNFIAQNRYRWFGRQETCLMPTPELKARFLD